MKNSLRHFRKKAGFKTLEDFAAATGLSVSAIGNVETGQRNPGEEFLQKACQVLGVSPEELCAPEPNTYGKTSSPLLQQTSESQKQLAAFLRAEAFKRHEDAQRQLADAQRFEAIANLLDPPRQP